MNLQIKNDVIQNPDISDYALAVFIALKNNCISTYNFQVVSPIWINFLLTDELKTELSRKKREGIINAIKELNEKFDLNITRCVGEKTFIVPTKSLKVDYTKGNYTTVNFDNVKKIIKNGGRAKWYIIHYYLLLSSYMINKITVCDHSSIHTCNILICNKSIADLSELTGIATTTISKYNKFLVDNEIIHINRDIEVFSKKTDGKKEVIFVKNTYGRYEDKDYIDKYVWEKYKHKNRIFKEKTSDLNRSLMQKYNFLVKNPDTDKYTNEEIQQIYDYIVLFNGKLKDTINKLETNYAENESNQSLVNTVEEYENKIKDLSVFDKFSFIERLKRY